jgi:hypothetical protein
MALVNAFFFIQSSRLVETLSAQSGDLDAHTLNQSPGDVQGEPSKLSGSVHESGEKIAHGAEKTDKREEIRGELGVAAKEAASHDETTHREGAALHEGAALEQEEEVGVIKSKYRPKLVGQCKNLFAKYEKKGDFTGNHRAFSYSFDGNSGNCAIVEEQKSQAIAEREALKVCEKSKTESKNYAPCFIMASF